MALQEEEVLAKTAVKLSVEMFCLAWCSNSLRIGRGTLPRHRLPGVREGKNVPESVHLFSVFGGNVRQSYFHIIRGVWIMLRLVLVRDSPRGL